MPVPKSLCVAAAVSLVLGGCASDPAPLAALDDANAPSIADVQADADSSYLALVDTKPAEQIPMYDGLTAEPVTGRDLQMRLTEADVVVIGEVHDDALAGPIEQRLVAAALPGQDGTGALTLEALERGRSTADSLADWPDAGEQYKQLITIARRAGVPILPANAQRVDAARARVEGEAAMRAGEGFGVDYELPTAEEREALADYEKAFEDVFAELSKLEGSAKAPSTQPGRAVSDFYTAQLVWDATMADSIATAYGQHGSPIVHVVGGFHSEFEGGLTTLLERRGLDVLTISILPVEAERLRTEDVGRADVVLYTGPERPMRWTTLATRPTTQPTTLPATRPTTAATRPGV